MKVHFIKTEHLHQLEREVNEWLEAHRYEGLFDIKYSPVPWYSSPEYSVMIIYR